MHTHICRGWCHSMLPMSEGLSTWMVATLAIIMVNINSICYFCKTSKGCQHFSQANIWLKLWHTYPCHVRDMSSYKSQLEKGGNSAITHTHTQHPSEAGHLHQQFHQSPTHPWIYYSLDFLIGAIRQVGESPACIRQQVWVTAEE